MRKLLLAVIVLVLLMILAFWKLLAINLSASQYAEYSSLRSDPKGAKVLYRGYEALPGVTAERSLQPIHRLKPTDSTVLFLGTGSSWVFSADLERELQRLAVDGNRIVLAFGDLPDFRIFEAEEEPAHDAEEAPVPAHPDHGDESDEEEFDVTILEFGLQLIRHEPGEPRCTEALDLSSPPTWHSKNALIVDETWTPLVEDEHGAVWMAERKFGSGSVVVSADSYWLSNEAMANNRSTEALLWLLGGHERVIFDESHLGVTMQTGVVALAKRYHMHGIALGLIILILLYIWRASACFLPSDEPADLDAQGVATDGLTALLRRNIPLPELLATCHRVWQSQHRYAPPEREAKVGPLCEDLPKKDLASVILSRYQYICRLLAGKD